MRTFTKTKFLAWKVFENHTLIIDSRTNKQVHRLNEVSAFLWNSLEENKTIDELSNSLISTYEIDKDTALNDVSAFIDSLLEKGLIHE